MADDRIRFTVAVDSDMYAKIEDFRFEARFKTMSGAVEDLLRRGLMTYYGECQRVKAKEE